MDRVTARQLIDRLNADASVIAGRFGLRYASITAERAGVNGHYGICYSDGTIKIRLRHAKTGNPLKYSSLVNTLCHELAHLRHFNHGPRFKAFYFELLDFARDQGIYKPGPRGRAEAPAPSRRGPRAVAEPQPPAKPATPKRRPKVGASPKPPQRGDKTGEAKPQGPRQLTLFA